eukprot:jgi/Bigna1/88977/estExt_fgenesh1_pg.C_410117
MGLLQHSSHVGLSLALLFLCLFEILAEESCTGKHDSGASTLPPHLGSRAELMRRSVRDLRELLRKMKVVDSNTLSMAGVLEKEDLVKRIMEGATKQCDWTNAGGPGLRPTDAEMNIAVPAEKIGRQPHKMKIGRLNCIVLQTHAKPEASIVLMHGFGANAEDLVNVGRGLQQRLRNGAKLRFIFPEGPVVLQEGSYAWWPLDISSLFFKIAQPGGAERLFDGQTEDIMRDSQSRVAELLELEKNAFGLDDSKIIVAGFSQGSWLATQVALSSSDDYGGLAIFSGGMYMPQTWPQKVSKKGAR